MPKAPQEFEGREGAVGQWHAVSPSPKGSVDVEISENYKNGQEHLCNMPYRKMERVSLCANSAFSLF